jgi:hypothetical protein
MIPVLLFLAATQIASWKGSSLNQSTGNHIVLAKAVKKKVCLTWWGE